MNKKSGNEQLNLEFQELNEVLNNTDEDSEDLAQLKLGFSQLEAIHDTKMQENQEEIKRLNSEINEKSQKLNKLETTLNEQLKEMEENTPNLNEDFNECVDQLEDDILDCEEQIQTTEKKREENQKTIQGLQAERWKIKARNVQELSSIKNGKLRKLKRDKDHTSYRKDKLQSKIETFNNNSQISLHNTESLNKQILAFKQKIEKPDIESTASKAKLSTLIRLVNSHIVRYSPEFMDIERGALNEVTALKDAVLDSSSNTELIETEVKERTNKMNDSLINLTSLIEKSSCPRSTQRKMINTLYNSRCIMETSKTTIPILESFVESFKDFHLYEQKKKSLTSSFSIGYSSMSRVPTINTTSTTKSHQQHHRHTNKSFSLILLKEADEGKKVLKLKDDLITAIQDISIIKLIEEKNHHNLKSLQNQIYELKQFCFKKSAKDLLIIQKWQDLYVNVVTKDAIVQAKKLHSVLNLNEESKRRIKYLKKKKERGLRELAKRDELGLINIHLCH